MMGAWTSLLAYLAVPAFVVAWSPVKIIPALVLILGSARPKSTGLAFLAGSMAGLASIIVLFTAIPHAFDGLEFTSVHADFWAPVAVVAGLALLTLAAYQWVTRHRPKRSRRWRYGFTRMSPLVALLLGVSSTVVNPKVIAMNAAAGVAIGAAAIGAAGTVLAVLLYTIVAGSTVLVPILGYVVAADRVDRWLESTRRAMRRHQAVATALILALLGLTLTAVGLLAR